ncbi:MAG: hypothetical protein RLZZ338_3779 [Cyanobacteriota bacterium]|jgi:type I restriction enzyme S subunit
MDDELYELPKGWVWVTVGEISKNIHYGYTASALPEVTEVKLLRITDIQNNSVNWDSVPYCTIDEDKKHQYLLKEGDLLFARTGATVGKSYLIDRKIPEAVFASYLIRIILADEVIKKFIYNLFQSNGYWLQIHQGKLGIGQPNVNAQVLSKITLPLPPLPEQLRIVDKIEELFTELDAGVELLKKLKAKLKRYRQAVLKAAVEGNLTKEWRTANQGELEPASVLLKRILKQRREKWETEQLAKMKAQGKPPKDDSWKLKYKEPLAPDTSDLPELPNGWCWASLISLCTAIGDVDHKMPKAQEQGIPYISTRDFLPNGNINFEDAKKISTEDFEKLCRKIYPNWGDILLSRYGTVGEVRLINNNLKFQASYSIAIIKPVFYEVNKFIAMCLQSDTVQNQIKKYIRGVAQPDLGLAHIKELILPFPSSLEQDEIISEMNRHISVIDELEKTIDTNLNRAEKLRQSILKQAFEGKLVPQDPNDEPAEKLLERIKAEKAKQTTTKTKRKTKSKKQSDLQLKLPLK